MKRATIQSRKLLNGSGSVLGGLGTASGKFRETLERLRERSGRLRNGSWSVSGAPEGLQERSGSRPGRWGGSGTTLGALRAKTSERASESERKNLLNRRSCSIPLSSSQQASGQLAPCMLRTGSLYRKIKNPRGTSRKLRSEPLEASESLLRCHRGFEAALKALRVASERPSVALREASSCLGPWEPEGLKPFGATGITN